MLAACGGGGGAPISPQPTATPTPTATPVRGPVAASLGSQPTSAPMPAVSGYSGTISFPSGSGSLSINTSASPSPGVPTLQVRRRSTPVTNTPLFYLTITATSAVTLNGTPGIAIALPPNAPLGPYYIGAYNGSYWSTAAGPVSAAGSTVTFAIGAGTQTLASGASIQVAMYAGSTLVTPAPYPTAQPGTIAITGSSFVNDKMYDLGPMAMPAHYGDARVYADFFQDGTLSMFTHTLEYNPSDPSTSTNYGHIYFYHLQSGAWVDETSKLISDTTGCLHPRKAIVADFNGDDKPDIFVACHGFDAPPYPGEQPLLLLSQPDGTYKKTFLPFTAFMHSASAAVLNKQGYADILVVDPQIAKTPYFLVNNGDGTFHQDFSRLPSTLLNKQIFSAELVDADGTGKYDVLLGGNDPNSQGSPDPYVNAEFPVTLYQNLGNNTYDDTHKLVVPPDTAYGGVLDFLFQNGSLYVLRTIDQQGPTFYDGVEVQKVAYPTMTATSIYTHTGAYPSGNTWVRWLYNYNGSIVTDDSSTPLQISP
jgi:hypothetical protein